MLGLSGIALTPFYQLEDIGIFTVLNVSIHECGISLYVFMHL